MEGGGLGLDGKLMLAQTINFILFWALFARFVAPSFFKFIKKLGVDEEERVTLLSGLQKKDDEAKATAEELLKEARVEAKMILQEAEKTAKSQREKLLKEATDEAHEIRVKAEGQIETLKRELMADVRSQVIKTSKKLIEVILKDTITKERQKEIVSQAFDKLPKHIDA